MIEMDDQYLAYRGKYIDSYGYGNSFYDGTMLWQQ